MTNFEMRIKGLTIDTLLHLEDEILECSSCYCSSFCKSVENEKLSCRTTRKLWLEKDEEKDGEILQ